jgi:plastocyanin
LLALAAWAQTAEPVHVSGTVVLDREGKAAAETPDFSNAVVWLKPAKSGPQPSAPEHRKFEMRQQNKRFDPHVLAVPAGSIVSFPNLDPFFHNVFSMFDGKRFDLGLYEAGASHSVTFDRAGVCYIFCNVHPEMSGVVVVMDTPYYTVTGKKGNFTIENLPAGLYFLSVWHERGKPEAPAAFPRTVSISGDTVLPPIHLRDTGSFLMSHKNKYGQDYDTPAPKVLVYK